MSDDILVTPDGKRFFRGVELQPGDKVCRCGINKHSSYEPKTALEMEQEFAEKMSKQILKEIDDDILASLTKAEEVFDTFGRSKGHKPI